MPLRAAATAPETATPTSPRTAAATNQGRRPCTPISAARSGPSSSPRGATRGGGPAGGATGASRLRRAPRRPVAGCGRGAAEDLGQPPARRQPEEPAEEARLPAPGRAGHEEPLAGAERQADLGDGRLRAPLVAHLQALGPEEGVRQWARAGWRPADSR